jgi:outer membrane immunogenic protein
MNKIALSALSLALLTTSALAADLTSRKEAVIAPPAPPTWTGFYAGLNAGGSWANNNNAQSQAIPLYTIDRSNIYGNKYIPGTLASVAGLTSQLYTNTNANFIGGVQIGYNKEIFGNVIIGAETDFQGLTANNGYGPFQFTSVPSTVRTVFLGDITTNTYTGMNAAKSVSYLGTLRARLGYTILPNLLVYGTGGLAYGGAKIRFFGEQEKVDQTDELGPGEISSSSVLVGWTAGGGAEWMFAPNWSLKAEYLYYNLGGLSTSNGGYVTRVHQAGFYPVPDIQPGAVVGLVQSRLNVNTIDGSIVRAGVNYHFNFASAPVVAKY